MDSIVRPLNRETEILYKVAEGLHNSSVSLSHLNDELASDGLRVIVEKTLGLTHFEVTVTDRDGTKYNYVVVTLAKGY